MLLLKEIVLQPHSFVKTLANTSIDKLNFFYNIKPLEKISKKGLGVKILITYNDKDLFVSSYLVVHRYSTC